MTAEQPNVSLKNHLEAEAFGQLFRIAQRQRLGQQHSREREAAVHEAISAAMKFVKAAGLHVSSIADSDDGPVWHIVVKGDQLLTVRAGVEAVVVHGKDKEKRTVVEELFLNPVTTLLEGPLVPGPGGTQISDSPVAMILRAVVTQLGI